MSGEPSTAGIADRITVNVRVDWVTGVLVALTLLVQLGAILVRPYIEAYTTVTLPAHQTGDVTLGVSMIGVLVVESLIIVGVWAAYKHTPSLVRKLIKTAALALLTSIGGVFAYTMYREGVLAVYATVAVALATALTAADHYDVKWFAWNAVALALAIGVVAVMSAYVTPGVVLVFLAAALVWDYTAVSLSGIMQYLVEFSHSISIPNYLVIPRCWRFDMATLDDWLTDDAEKPDGLAAVIGVGDFVLPALLAASTAAALPAGLLSLPALGAVAGTCAAVPVLVGALHQRDTGLPALVWLNTGSILGFLAGVAASDTTLAVLGVAA